MRKTAYCILLFLTTIGIIYSSCMKKELYDNSNKEIYGEKIVTKIPEIGLGLDINYLKENPDSFKVIISQKFNLQQFNSLYNVEQQVEYFNLKINNIDDNKNYFIFGAINSATNAITLKYIENNTKN